MSEALTQKVGHECELKAGPLQSVVLCFVGNLGSQGQSWIWDAPTAPQRHPDSSHGPPQDPSGPTEAPWGPDGDPQGPIGPMGT